MFSCYKFKFNRSMSFGTAPSKDSSISRRHLVIRVYLYFYLYCTRTLLIMSRRVGLFSNRLPRLNQYQFDFMLHHCFKILCIQSRDLNYSVFLPHPNAYIRIPFTTCMCKYRYPSLFQCPYFQSAIGELKSILIPGHFGIFKAE